MEPVKQPAHGFDPSSAALGAGVVAPPLIAYKVAELLKKNEDGENGHGEQNFH